MQTAAQVLPIFTASRVNTGSAATTTFSGNTIGGTVANSLQGTSAAAATQMVGFFLSTSIGVVSNNTTNPQPYCCRVTGTTTGASVIGIAFVSATPLNTVAQNTIFNLSNTNATAATIVTGIQFTGASGSIVERNFIHSLTTATNSATAELNGIRVAGGTTTYRNNMIALGAGTANAIGAVASNSSASGINGFNGFLGTDNFWHNSIYIGGTATAGTGASYAFNGVQTTNTRSFRDNIFFNARSGGGSHSAVKINAAAPPITGLTINNNIYFTSGTGGVLGFINGANVVTLAAWKTATGQDAVSLSGNPQFIAPAAATPNLHLDAVLPTLAEGNGFDLGITNDFDGETRSGLTPVDIGADAGNFVSAGDVILPSISYTLLPNQIAAPTSTLGSVIITDAGSGVNGAPGTRPRLYYKKSTNAVTLAATNTSASDGWKFVEANGSSSPFDFTIDYSLLFSTGTVVAGETIQYFVVAQDLAGTPNVAINSGSFAVIPASVALTSTAFPIGGTINSYLISASIGGPVTVGTGGTYTSLTNAGGLFEAINNNVVSSSITATIISNITGELGTFALNEFAPGFTVTIKPTGVARTVTGSNTGALIRINAADNVTIDGSLGSTANTVCPVSVASRDLTFIQTDAGTAGGVIWLQSNGANGATGNTIKNCIITGNSATTTLIALGSGSATVSTSSLGTGNNNNSFVNNNISKSQFGIYSQGASAASKNSGTVINQNLVNTVSPNNVATIGILVGFENSISIAGNNVGGMEKPGSPDVFGISLGATGLSTSGFTGNEVTNATITNNIIGSVRNTGTFSAAGLFVAPATSGTNLIANNMVSGVSANGTSGDFGVGIFIGGGTGSLQTFITTLYTCRVHKPAAAIRVIALLLPAATR